MKTLRLSLITACLLLLSVLVSSCYAASDSSRTVVLTDVHGDYATLVELLKKTQVLDSKLKWSGGNTTLISLGDNLDRGAHSRQVIDLFMRLEKEATASGGEVIVLLGNHEIMNIIADLRYVSDQEFLAFKDDESSRYRDRVYRDFLSYSQREDNDDSQQLFNQLYPPGYFGLVEAYSPKGKYGKWLLGKDTLRVHQGRLYLHAGISKELLDMGLSEQELNQAIRETTRSYAELYHEFIKLGLFKHYFSKSQRKEVLTALLRGEIAAERFNNRKVIAKAKRFLDLADSLLITTYGPVWYRGNIYCHEYMESQTVDRALKHFGVSQILVGHTPDQSRVARSRFGGKVILLDTGMLQTYYKGQPTAAVISNNQLRLVNLNDPTNTQPLPDPVRKPLYPNGLSDDYLQGFFSQAQVVTEKPLNGYYTKPIKLTFEKAGTRHSAIFKYMDSDPKLEDKRRGNKLDDFADRYIYDLAAYKLDRMLGLYMIPFAMPYQFKGQSGIIQYWIEDSVSKTELIQAAQQIDSYCSIKDEEALMQIFDLLIYNDDRNTGNKLYSLDSGFLWLIDHSRSFRTKSKLPDYEKPMPDYLSPALADKLKALTKESLQKELGDYLNAKQIQGLLQRRNKLLQHYYQ